MALTTEIILHFHFHFKVFPEKERERERVRGRKKIELQSSLTIVGEPRAPVRANLASSSLTTAIRDRDLAKHRADCYRRGASRDRDRCFARSRRRLRSHDVDRNLTKIAISPS